MHMNPLLVCEACTALSTQPRICITLHTTSTNSGTQQEGAGQCCSGQHFDVDMSAAPSFTGEMRNFIRGLTRPTPECQLSHPLE